MSKLRYLLPSPHSLFVFEAAARNLNFKVAASELNVTQPSVSHSIKSLEQHCGVNLFIRENRGVRLTEAGRLLYEDVRSSFLRIEQTLRSVSERDTNYITLAASTVVSAFWLVSQLHHFQQQHPTIKIKLLTTDRDVEPNEEIDLTIWVRKGDFERKNCWRICDEVVFPVCSPTYLASKPPVKKLADLERHQLLHFVDPFRKRITWEEWFELAGRRKVEIERRTMFNDALLASQAAVAGEGIALGWNLTLQLVLKNRLVVKPIDINVKTDSAFFLVGNEHATEGGKLQVLVNWFLAQTEELRR
jgi:LysR family glycine cleavage system transcriptional activator